MLGLGALRFVMFENDVGHWTDMFIVLLVSRRFYETSLEKNSRDM